MPVLDVIKSIKETVVKKFYPDYNVILHNDDRVYYLDVLKGLQEVIRLSFTDAQQVMMSAHTNGKSVATTCNQERAEAYQEMLFQHGLTITIEKA